VLRLDSKRKGKLSVLLQYELIEAILNLLNVCKIPFQKEKASDELHQVPFLPTFFNSLCEYLKFEYDVPEDREPTEEELGLMEEFDLIKQ